MQRAHPGREKAQKRKGKKRKKRKRKEKEKREGRKTKQNNKREKDKGEGEKREKRQRKSPRHVASMRSLICGCAWIYRHWAKINKNQRGNPDSKEQARKVQKGGNWKMGTKVLLKSLNRIP